MSINTEFYHTISPLGPLAPHLSILSSGHLGVTPRLLRDGEVVPDQLWSFKRVALPIPETIYTLSNLSTRPPIGGGNRQALAINTKTKLIELADRDEGAPEQQWIIHRVSEGDGERQVVRIGNVWAGQSVTLEIGEGGRIVIGGEGGDGFRWVVRQEGMMGPE